jgi:transcriptional regulator with XRE-family HTH domain
LAPNTNRSPTVRRWELASILRDLRLRAGMTIEDVAEQLLCSPSKVSRMETGQRAATLRDVRDLSIIYQVDDARRDELMKLAREARQRGWWQEYSDYSDVAVPYSTYIGLEAAAVSLRSYESTVFPGLLQTKEYALALFDENWLPDRPREYVEERIAVRMTRQRRLSEDQPVQFHSIVDYSVADRIIGSSKTMAAQLRHVVTVAERDNVRVQLLPREAGAYPGIEASAFTVLTFASTLADTVYVESIMGSLFVERDAEVERISRIFQHQSSIALDDATTRAYLTERADEFEARGR